MKKYLLRLINNDIKNTKHSIDCWHKMLEPFKNDCYQIKRLKSLERHMEKIKKYRWQIENDKY